MQKECQEGYEYRYILGPGIVTHAPPQPSNIRSECEVWRVWDVKGIRMWK